MESVVGVLQRWRSITAGSLGNNSPSGLCQRSGLDFTSRRL